MNISAEDMARVLCDFTLEQVQKRPQGVARDAPQERARLTASVVVALLRSAPVRAYYGERAGDIHDCYLAGLTRRAGMRPRDPRVGLSAPD